MDKVRCLLIILSAAVVAVLIIAPVTCAMQRQALIVDAIKAGADPIAARCAIEGEGASSGICLVMASKKIDK